MTRREIDELGQWCARKHGATRDNTFGPQTDVYRVGEKIFAMVNLDDPGFITLKADPDDALALRQQHEFIRPGYYMNKRHWITVDAHPDLSPDEARELIDDSYRLVFGSLTKAKGDRIVSEAPGPA